MKNDKTITQVNETEVSQIAKGLKFSGQYGTLPEGEYTFEIESKGQLKSKEGEVWGVVSGIATNNETGVEYLFDNDQTRKPFGYCQIVSLEVFTECPTGSTFGMSIPEKDSKGRAFPKFTKNELKVA